MPGVSVSMSEFEKVLIDRDEMSDSRARKERQSAASIISDMVADGASYDEVEEFLADEYGLEMDYLLDLI